MILDTNYATPKCVRGISSTSSMTFAEYFAGIGLVRLGLERAGWHSLFANDFSQQKFDMYNAYFRDVQSHYIVEDVFNISSDEVPTTLLATASFPCIDLSLAGNLKGLQGHHSSAFWGFIDLIRAQKQRPLLILLENVMGWLTSNKNADFKLTIQALNELGYSCDVFIINAAHFVPQSRPRVFVVGLQTNSPNGDYSKLLRRNEDIASKTLKKVVGNNLDLDWHILDIPNLPKRGAHYLVEIVENLEKNDDRWWSEQDVRRHYDMMSLKHKQAIDILSTLSQYSYKSMYRRMRKGIQRAEVREDDIAGCLRTARGGSSRQIIVKAGYGDIAMRLMTPREYARLQGVPDSYPIPIRQSQALTGFGDAVCVPAVTWIAKYVLNPLVAQPMDRSTDRA